MNTYQNCNAVAMLSEGSKVKNSTCRFQLLEAYFYACFSNIRLRCKFMGLFVAEMSISFKNVDNCAIVEIGTM